MSGKRTPWWLLAAGLLAVLGCEPAGDSDDGIDRRYPAPPFTLERLGGGSVSLSDWAGKPVILDFWATWCPPCEFQVPELNVLYERYRDDAAVGIFGITIDEGADSAVREWMDEKGVIYPVLLGDDGLAREYGALGFPTFVLIAPDGKIAWTHAGVIEHEDIQERLDSLFQRE